MKAVLSLLLVFVFSIYCIPAKLEAQAIEKRVALAPVSYSPGSNGRQYAEQLYNHIITTFHQTQRVKVIDNLFAHGLIVQEKKLQSDADFVEGHVVEKGKSEGADYIMFIHVNSIKAYKQVDKEGKTLGYKGDITLFVRLFNVKTRLTESTDKITQEGVTAFSGYEEVVEEAGDQVMSGLVSKINGSTLPSTEEEAIDRAMNDLEPHVRSFVNKAFPLEMRVADIQQDKGSKKSKYELWIKEGKLLGLKRSDKLTVRYEYEQNIGDDVVINFSEIGRVKVVKFSGDYAICHFMKGEKDIIEKFSEDNKSLKVTPDLGKFNPFRK